MDYLHVQADNPWYNYYLERKFSFGFIGLICLKKYLIERSDDNKINFIMITFVCLRYYNCVLANVEYAIGQLTSLLLMKHEDYFIDSICSDTSSSLGRVFENRFL